jgi:hypothetical protein
MLTCSAAQLLVRVVARAPPARVHEGNFQRAAPSVAADESKAQLRAVEQKFHYKNLRNKNSEFD